jgi:regulator of protease activity HflC (stomatin/prohibitin superfamily)
MDTHSAHAEKPFDPISAWPVLAGQILLLATTIVAARQAIVHTDNDLIAPGLLGVGVPLVVLMLCGYFVVSPNDSRALVLFGRYRGTVRSEGFWWTNPFTIKKRVSLKAHNKNGDRLKVNDLAGNPIEIAAIVVWRVRDTARALFDVEDYPNFVSIQSEAAVRALASRHPYDEGHSTEVSTTLRGSADVVAEELSDALQQRLDRAGVEVIEARLSHLAYAQEIASAMLQRQQASAIISARAMIVEGAVGMVEMAIDQLAKGGRVELDDERKATLVGNLLVVLCSHENPQPVLNTGSLYT